MGKILSSWKARYALLLASVIVCVSMAYSLIKGVQGMKDALFWIEWVYWRANTPWAGIFVIVLLGVLFWRGVKDIEKAAREGDQKNQEVGRLRQEAQSEALALPTMIIQSFVKAEEVQRLAIDVDKEIKVIELYMGQLRFWLRDECIVYLENVQEGLRMPPAGFSTQRYSSLSLADVAFPTFPVIDPVLVPHGPSEMHQQMLYLKTNNDVFVLQVANRTTELQTYCGNLHKVRDDATEAVTQQKKDIVARMKYYGQ